MTDQSGRKAFEYNVPPISDDQLYDLEVSVDETHSFGLFVRHDFYAIMARLRAAEAERDRMREALKPFCYMETNLDSSCSDSDQLECYEGVTAGDVRRARKLVEGGE
jgi:hypothetical protein